MSIIKFMQFVSLSGLAQEHILRHPDTEERFYSLKFLLNYAYEELFLHFIAFLQQLRALKYNIKTLLTADAVTVKVDPMHCLFSKDLCSSFGNSRSFRPPLVPLSDFHYTQAEQVHGSSFRVLPHSILVCFRLFIMVYPHCNAMRLCHGEVCEEWEPSNHS